MAVKTAQKVNQPKKRAAAKKPVARKRVQDAPSQTGQFFRENARLMLVLFSAVMVGVLLFVGYQAATASSVFQTNKIDIQGTERASLPAVEVIAKRLTAKTGVWNADLDLIRKEVERLTWVKSATVSRVLPDGIRIRVTERNPVAVVRLETGKLVWVDEEAKILGAVTQNEKAPPFAMLGWNEEASDAARKNNLERISLYLKLIDEFQQLEIANMVTAVDLSDLQEVKIFVEKDGTILPIQVGQTDFGSRLKLSLEVLDQTSRAGRLQDVEKIISHGSRVSVVPRKGLQLATNETGKIAKNKQPKTR